MTWFLHQCSRERQCLSLLASGMLSEEQIIAARSHLAGCERCRKYLAEINETIQPFVTWEKRFTHVAPAPAMQMRWAKAIRAANRSESLARFSPRIFLNECWLQLIWPSRRIWAGLAAAWLLIMVVNLNLKTGGPHLVTASSPVFNDFMLAWREQEKIMAELTERSEPRIVEPPKAFVPQPRSDRCQSTFA